MSKPLKLFFDHTSSPKLPSLLRDFYAWEHPDMTAVHLRHKFDQNTDDQSWLSTLSAEGSWIVISEDRARTSRVQPMPLICQRLKITHVLVSDALRRFEDMKQALAECWREIVALSEMPPGTRAVLRYRSHRSEERKAVLMIGDSKVSPQKKRRSPSKNPVPDNGVKAETHPDLFVS